MACVSTNHSNSLVQMSALFAPSLPISWANRERILPLVWVKKIASGSSGIHRDLSGLEWSFPRLVESVWNAFSIMSCGLPHTIKGLAGWCKSYCFSAVWKVRANCRKFKTGEKYKGENYIVTPPLRVKHKLMFSFLYDQDSPTEVSEYSIIFRCGILNSFCCSCGWVWHLKGLLLARLLIQSI